MNQTGSLAGCLNLCIRYPQTKGDGVSITYYTMKVFIWRGIRVLILSLLLPCLPSEAQIFRGQVIDIQDESPLFPVQFQYPDSTVAGYSGEAGRFEFLIPPGPSRLRLVKPGYQTTEITVNPESEPVHIGMTPSSISLAEVKITSYASGKSNRETAGSLAVIQGEQLRQGSGISLQSAFNSVPGLQMDQSHLSESRVSIRGSGIRAPWGIRNVKIYLNDIPITEADGTSRLEAIDVHDLGSVEIIKGPASSLYGGGTGGVIRFQLQRASYLENSLSLSSLVGSYGLKRWAATYRHGGDKMNAYLSFGEQSLKGYRAHSQDFRRFLAANLQVYPNEDQTVTFVLSHSRQEAQIPGALSELQMMENPRQAAPTQIEKNAGRNQTWTRFGMSHQYRPSSRFHIRTSLFQYAYDLDHPLPFAYIRNTYQSLGGRTQFQWRPGKSPGKVSMIWGAEGNSAKTKGTQFQNLGGKEGPIQSAIDYTFINYALFAHGEYQLLRHTRLTAGLSYNGIQYQVGDYLSPDLSGERNFDPALSPRLSISQRLLPGIFIHGSISAGYSPPSSAEIKDAEGRVNPEIHAERGTNYEINLKGGFLDQRWIFDLAFFQMDMKGELIGQSIHQGITVYHNVGRSQHRGAEASLTWHPLREADHKWLRLWMLGALSYSDFRFIDYRRFDAQSQQEVNYRGNQIPGISPWVLHLATNLSSRPGIYGQTQLHLKDKAPLNDANTDYVSGYLLVHAKLGYRRKLGEKIGLDLHAGLDNLTDAKYSSLVSLNAPSYGGSDPAYYHPSAGRQGYVGVRLNYHF